MSEPQLSKPIAHFLFTSVLRVTDGKESALDDTLAVEEPLEIRADFPVGVIRTQKSVSITMRTPGHDRELAVGFLFTEGMIASREDVIETHHCGPALPHLGHSNVIKVSLTNELRLQSLERHFYTTSSCGVCGKASIDALKTQNQYTREPNQNAFVVSSGIIPLLPDRLRAAQEVFEATGGLHASGLFSSDGNLLLTREDVGRHNALDKVIGWALLENQLPLSNMILLVSGRVSFELVQKAAMAGVRIIAAVGAPSSLALELAREMNMTLIGFVRGRRFNVYCGAERIK